MKTVLWSSLLAIGFLMAGCTQKEVVKDLDVKESQTSSIKGAGDLQSEAADLITRSNLSADKKAQLTTLRLATEKQLEAYRDESLRLRSLLIKDVMAPTYNRAEVGLIKSRMSKVERQRLATIFDTVDKANTILGHDVSIPENERMVHEMLYLHELR